MPSPATLVGEWHGPPSMMKMHGMMTSKPHMHSGGGMAWASLNDEDAPVHHIVQREDGGHGEPVNGKMEASRGSPGW